MAAAADLVDVVDTIFGKAFDEREGRTVPTTDDVKLSDGAVKIRATFLYADLAGSRSSRAFATGPPRLRSFEHSSTVQLV